MVNRPRLLVVLLCLFAGTAVQAQFLPYFEFKFTGQPSNAYFDGLGLKRTHGVYEDQVTGGTIPVKESLMRSTAHSTLANYLMYENRMFYDIEYLDTDSFRVGKATAVANAQALAQYIGWAKNEEPNLKVGLYSQVPVTDLFISTRLAKRQSADNLIQMLADSVDYLLPSIYLYYAETKRSYASYAVPMIAEARRMAKGKKVFAFITPGYHPSGDFPNQYASYSVWMNVLRVIKDSAKADGIFIFGGVGAMGSQYSDWARIDTSGWWRATKDFLAALQGGGTPPAVPSMISPSQGAVIDPPTFTSRWRKAANATLYHLQLADNPGFTNPLVNDSSLTDTSRSISPLNSGATYYIRVRAKGVYGSSSFSPTIQFSTSVPPPPAAPTVVAPQQGTTVDPPAVSVRWRKPVGALRYHLQVSESSGFVTTLVNDSTVTDTLRLVGSLNAGTTYFVRVRAKGVSSWSTFSSTVQFSTTTPPLPAPSLLAPAAGAVLDAPSVTARWSKVTGALLYQIQLATSSTFQSPLLNDSTLTDTTRVIGSLGNGMTYYLRLRAKGTPGWGSYGSTVQFQTSTPPPAAPMILAPVQGAVVDPIGFIARWRRAAGAVVYHLQLSESSTFQSLAINDSTLSDTLRQISGLKGGTPYFLRLRAKGIGSWGAFSSTDQFTTSSPPVLTAPALVSPLTYAVIDPYAIMIRWSKIAGASRYHLQLASAIDFQNLLVNDSTLVDTARQVGPFSGGMTYFVRVRAWGASGWSSFGAAVQFSTAVRLPFAPTLMEPASGSVVDPPAVIARWGKVTDALSYHLQVADNWAFQGALVNDSTLTDTVRTVSSLDRSTTYYLRLRTKGSVGWSGYTNTFLFSTSALIYVSVASEKPTATYLTQNYPNPFNPTTTIRFSIRQSSAVRLDVYNTLGEIVRRLVHGDLQAGVYNVLFDASGLPSGVYIYRIQAGTFVDTKRLLLIK